MAVLLLRSQVAAVLPPRSGGTAALHVVVSPLCSGGTVATCYIFNEYSAVYLAVLYAASEKPLRSCGTALTSKKHKYHSKKPAAKEVAPLIMK